MSKLLLSLAAAVALAVPSLALACPAHAGAEASCEKAGCDKAGCEKADCPHRAKAKDANAKDGHESCDHDKSKGGCSCNHHDKAEKASWKSISIGELAALGGKSVTVVDVNNADVRAKMGVIPGAVLASSSSQYDLAQLPSDKAAKLVFYCANTRCTASHTAANRAIEAGYTDVNVLPDGIKGWKEAGKATSTPRS